MTGFNLGIPPTPPPRRPLATATAAPTIDEQLLPCKWRHVEFPASSVHTSFDQDLAEHKYWGIDGADVEAMGRGAITIEAEIPFINDLAQGKAERWASAGALYPTIFRAFLAAFFDRTTGPFQHPELGVLQCKPRHIDFAHDAHVRNGVIVRASWLETQDANGQVLNADVLTIESSPIHQAMQAAIDLDASTADIRSLFDGYQPPQFEESFEDAVNKIAGIFDQASTSIQLAANKPAQILSRLNQLQRSADGLRSAMTWPINDAVARLREAVMAIPQALGASGRTAKRFTTTTNTTLVQLAGQFKNKVDDLINLNPNLISSDQVIAGTVVRYYG